MPSKLGFCGADSFTFLAVGKFQKVVGIFRGPGVGPRPSSLANDYPSVAGPAIGRAMVPGIDTAGENETFSV